MLREWKLAVGGGAYVLGIVLAGALPACSPRSPSRSADGNRRQARAGGGGRTQPANPAPFVGDGNLYPWTTTYDSTNALANRIAPPEDYVRAPAQSGSFAYWLRGLPLKPGRPDVLLYNGQKKANQEAHHAVVDMDVGTKDLQQCADAVMRLRAEYLRSVGREAEISFRTGSGFALEWAKWEAGDRPRFTGRGSWRRSAQPDSSYRNFRAYLDEVFAYVGTASLSPQLVPVPRPADMRIGDVFIRGGRPGHAVIVADMAECEGDKVFLLAQSYMPAQEVEILRNPTDANVSPWYDLDFEDELETPEYTFQPQELRRFPP
jgi:hypothetical protein